MAQKGGAVHSYCVANDPHATMTAKISKGEADLLLGCDVVASVAPIASGRSIPRGRGSSATAVSAPTASFTKDAYASFDSDPLVRRYARS
jgi:indolepyruvate ferredoxin oxidoreductase